MVLVDSHCHLNYPCFEQAEGGIGAVLAKAAQANVHYVQTICTKLAEFEHIYAMAEAHQNLFCSFGIHPHHAGEDMLSVNDIVSHASRPRVIGIGETGLDYFYNHAPREKQIISFKNHLAAARQLNLPVIIHTRDAEEDTMHVLDEALAEGPLKLLFHCFSSSEVLARYAVEKGIYLSASGIITFNKAEEVRQGFALAPLHLLLVETDAPYLAPTPHRGKENHPAYTHLVAQKLAELKGLSTTEVAQATTHNFFTLFNKAATLARINT